jgi:hypothetical protein
MAEEQLAHLQVGCAQASCFETSKQAALLLLMIKCAMLTGLHTLLGVR